MRQIKETLVSPWRGSEKTAEDVREQVRERYGDDAAEEFDAASDAMPLSSWASYGFRIRRGERALKSITIVEVKDENDKVVRKIKRTVNLFHKRQVLRAS